MNLLQCDLSLAIHLAMDKAVALIKSAHAQQPIPGGIDSEWSLPGRVVCGESAA
jgi:hypothetical protein